MYIQCIYKIKVTLNVECYHIIPTLKCILSSLNIYCFAGTINLLLIIIPGKDIALLFDGASFLHSLYDNYEKNIPLKICRITTDAWRLRNQFLMLVQ
jgi:hypothetical protein